jgi:TPR repeat protein
VSASEPPGAEQLQQLLQTAPSQAHGQLLAAALAGHCASQLAMAQAYLEGIGCERHAQEAVYWFQQAAHQDAPAAMNMLGRCYENGWGASVDYALAAVWYRRAAAYGSDWGLYNYAHVLANGRGVPKDRAQAFVYFGLAAAAGHARAMHFLGQYHEHGWETPADLGKARALYRRSAEAGDYRGQCSWASFLAEEGRTGEASALLRSALAAAPAYFADALLEQLKHSRHPELRALAD